MGKTRCSIQLARHFSCPILSADSRQVYKEMHIGTAKPSKEELSQADHFLIGHKSIIDNYSVGAYLRDAERILNQLFKEHDLVIAVGGTGLYLKALTEGIDEFPEVTKETKEELQSIYESEGLTALQEMIKNRDPQYAHKVDLNNPHRLIRALSVILTTGQTFSSFLQQSKNELRYKSILISFQLPREVLYERINKRVDDMMNSGLLEEAQQLFDKRALPSLNTVGYKELFDYLKGDCELNYAIDKIKQHTRNYAKRQITWFKNQQAYHPFAPYEIESVISFVEEQINPKE